MADQFTKGQCKPWEAPLIMIASEGDFVNGQNFCLIKKFCGQTGEDVTALPQLILKEKISYKIAAGYHRFKAVSKAFWVMKGSMKRVKERLEETHCTYTEGDGEDLADQKEHDAIIERCEKEIELLEECPCLSSGGQWWSIRVVCV